MALALAGCALGRPALELPGRLLHELGRVQEPEPLTFAVMADWGFGGEHQQQVGQALAAQARIVPFDFVITAGDNFYPYGVESPADPQWEQKFEAVYAGPELAIPFFAALGNHDHLGNVRAQVEYTDTQRRWRMPARYYHFERELGAGQVVQFIVLDTQALERGDSAQFGWLMRTCALSSPALRVVVGHHPLYSGGRHGPTLRLREQIEELLVAAGVDLYFSGHDHSLQLLGPIRGILYLVVGGGGATLTAVTPLPDTRFAVSAYGFAWCQVAAGELAVEFIGADGQRLYAARFPLPDLQPTPTRAGSTE